MNNEIFEVLESAVVIQGKSHMARVTISITPDLDCDPLDQHFETEKQRQDFMRKLDNGTYQSIGVMVVAELAGEVGRDSLWGCLVEGPKSLKELIDAHGMVENAVLELKANLRSQHENLTKLFA